MPPIILGEPNPFTYSEAALLGFAAGLVAGSARARLSVAALDAWLRPAIALGQIAMRFGERNMPLGFVTWAYVMPEDVDSFGRRGGRPPDPEEWNAGTELWIVDVMAPYGGAFGLLAAVAGRHSDSHSRAWFVDRRSSAGRAVRLRRRGVVGA